jgi:hypothetical protein
MPHGRDAPWAGVNARLVVGHGPGEPIRSWLAAGDGWLAVDTGHIELLELRAGRRTELGDARVEHTAGGGGTWAYFAEGALHVVDVRARRRASIAIADDVVAIEVDEQGQVLVHRSSAELGSERMPNSRVERACSRRRGSCIVVTSRAHFVDWDAGLLVPVDPRLQHMGSSVLLERDGALVRVSGDGEEEVASADCRATVLAVSSIDDTIVMRCGSSEPGYLAVWHAGRFEQYRDLSVVQVERSEEVVAIIGSESAGVDLHTGVVHRGITGRPVAVLDGYVVSTMLPGEVEITDLARGEERSASGLDGMPRAFGTWVAFEQDVIDFESGRVTSLAFKPLAITSGGLALATGDGPFRWSSVR